MELYVLYLHTPLYSHCVVLNETWRQLYLIWSVFMLIMCLLTAQTVVCTTGGGLPFKIMYLFAGNSDTVLVQVMKDDHIVICALCRQGLQLLQTELVNILYCTLCCCYFVC